MVTWEERDRALPPSNWVVTFTNPAGTKVTETSSYSSGNRLGMVMRQ